MSYSRLFELGRVNAVQLLFRIFRDTLYKPGITACVFACACSGDSRLDGLEFHRVVMDESTQATEPEGIVPLVKGAKKVKEALHILPLTSAEVNPLN